MKVQLKIKGEARSREAEADFVESLQKNPFFEQVILEREGERQGGGVDFDYTLAASSNPPPYRPLPKHRPAAQADGSPGSRPRPRPGHRRAPARRPPTSRAQPAGSGRPGGRGPGPGPARTPPAGHGGAG